MSTFEIVSLVANVALMTAFLWVYYPKVVQHINKLKKQRETRRDKGRQLENARLVKLVRTEVRKYLEELQTK